MVEDEYSPIPEKPFWDETTGAGDCEDIPDMAGDGDVLLALAAGGFSDARVVLDARFVADAWSVPTLVGLMVQIERMRQAAVVIEKPECAQ